MKKKKETENCKNREKWENEEIEKTRILTSKGKETDLSQVPKLVPHHASKLTALVVLKRKCK